MSNETDQVRYKALAALSEIDPDEAMSALENFSAACIYDGSEKDYYLIFKNPTDPTLGHEVTHGEHEKLHFPRLGSNDEYHKAFSFGEVRELIAYLGERFVRQKIFRSEKSRKLERHRPSITPPGWGWLGVEPDPNFPYVLGSGIAQSVSSHERYSPQAIFHAEDDSAMLKEVNRVCIPIITVELPKDWDIDGLVQKYHERLEAIGLKAKIKTKFVENF